MKLSFILAAAFAFALPAGAFVAATTTPAAAAAHVRVHKHGGVTVRGHHRHGGGVWHKPRAHEFHWRGKWIGRVHGAKFVWPRGHHYRHWAVGARLPLVFVGSTYYYDNYASFGFHAPPMGYRWVRYGDDLVLVNVRTGEIEDVAYGVFN